VYRFACRGRWLVGHVIVLGLAVLFIRLGIWQLSRLHQEHVQEGKITTRLHSSPVPLDSLVASGTSTTADVAFRRVEVTGRYDPAHQLTVRFRVVNDSTGDYVLTPLITSSGAAIVVNRGWIPEGAEPDVPSVAVPPPSGPVTVTGLLLDSEKGNAAPERRGGQIVQVSKIDITLLQQDVAFPLYPVYLQLQSQQPGTGGGFPLVLPPPDLANGPPHLSYAIQWFLFTTIGLVGWPLLIRKSARERAREQTTLPQTDDVEASGARLT
jgi:cytochrome oxidase assembly protein ShyY1